MGYFWIISDSWIMGDFWIMGDSWTMGDFGIAGDSGLMGDFGIMGEGDKHTDKQTDKQTNINTMTRPGLRAGPSEHDFIDGCFSEVFVEELLILTLIA